MFVEDFVMKMEVEGRDRELDPGRAEDVTCPGEAQDGSKLPSPFAIIDFCCPKHRNS